VSAITLETARTMLTAYINAETAVLSGQAYEIAGRRLTRADLATIQAGREKWANEINLLERSASGRSRSRTMIYGGR
jgi:hypothetical protein